MLGQDDEEWGRDPYHLEGEERVKFDKSMEVPKDDGRRQEQEVAGIPHEEADKLDNLGEAEHEDELGPESILAISLLPTVGRLPASHQ